jgi:pectate lyase
MLSHCEMRGRSAPLPLSRALLIVCALLALLALLTPGSGPARAQSNLPAFPGASGHGSRTVGGRGGAVIEVTTLNSAGPGSLRAALEAKGPRIVVFRVGGTIRHSEALAIREPFLTIAGQTAPGDGITIRGPGLAIMTHDVIVRGLRIRVGADDGVDHQRADGLRVDGGWNVIVDHCSLSWGGDENLSTSTFSGATHDVTFQYNIVSEALWHSKHPEGAHSMGLLIGERSERISVHHNLLAHNNQRNPLVKGAASVELVNNVIYDWGEIATELVDPEGHGPAAVNLVGNSYKAGPATLSATPVKQRVPAQLYLSGNAGVADAGAPAAPASDLAAESAAAAYGRVLASAGAIAPRRDSVDARVIGEVQRGGGRVIDSPGDVGGWPDVAPGTPPADGDHDGMPDAWEAARGLNAQDPADRNARSAAGYTMVEEYLNGLIAGRAGGAPSDLPFKVYAPDVRRP